MKVSEKLRNPYIVLAIMYIYFIVVAFCINSPGEILDGLNAIIQSHDILITDYVEIAGIGAALVNSALLSLIMIVFFVRSKIKPTGATIMMFWLLSGFSFFGKNIVNIWPVILGGFLYAKFKKESFSKYAVVTMLATSLSPAVSQIAFEESLPFPVGLLLGILLGLFLGFIMSPIADNAVHSHHGYNLYNAGFAAGIIAMILRIMLKAFGLDIAPVFIWNTDSTLPLSIFLVVIFAALIVLGLFLGKNNKENIKQILRRTGRLASDFYLDYGESCYINMGILGLLATFSVLLLGGNINGPVMGCIFTVAGFGCFGKHIKNTVPIMLGCVLGAALLHINGQNPAVILAILLGTCLAPVAGTFGWGWGIIAGFLHINISVNIGELSGGMNLYNNGLAGGLVIMFLLPLIRAFKTVPDEP